MKKSNKKILIPILLIVIILLVLGYLFLFNNKEKHIIQKTDQQQEEFEKQNKIIIPNEDTFEITSDEIFFNGLSAFTKKMGEYNYVILKKDGKEIIIDKAPNDYKKDLGNTLFFKNLEFSSNGEYLKYMAEGWEWSIGRIYNIKDEKQVLNLQSMWINGFTPDNKYFYACAHNLMGGDHYVNIYTVPEFELIKSNDDFDIFGDTKEFPMNLDCEFVSDKNILSITTSDFTYNTEDGSKVDQEKKINYEYNFDTKVFNKK